MGTHVLALLDVLDTACHNVDRLEDATTEASGDTHHEIITSFPGLSDTTGAVVLAEIGDTRDRSPTRAR
jgi:hypothetical protein